jgi:hypothetical protein
VFASSKRAIQIQEIKCRTILTNDFTSNPSEYVDQGSMCLIAARNVALFNGAIKILEIYSFQWFPDYKLYHAIAIVYKLDFK